MTARADVHAHRGRPDWWDESLSPAACLDCGETFQPRAEWQTRCLDCYRASKATRGNAPADDMHALRAECERLRAELSEARRRAVQAEFLGGAAPAIVRELAEHLPRLLLVAHPDRHQNSEASTQATAWLLGLRRRLEVPDGGR